MLICFFSFFHRWEPQYCENFSGGFYQKSQGKQTRQLLFQVESLDLSYYDDKSYSYLKTGDNS